MQSDEYIYAFIICSIGKRNPTECNSMNQYTHKHILNGILLRYY